MTELVDGGTLEQWLTGEPRPWRQTVKLMLGVADALAVAHAANIVHRDIKPGNALLSRAGYAKLADFGLAKSANATDSYAGAAGSVTRADAVVGTPAYMSPEQIAGRGIDARTDVFAFGVVVYELLTGRRPFDGTTEVDVMHSVTHASPLPLPADVPSALRTNRRESDRKRSERAISIDA